MSRDGGNIPIYKREVKGLTEAPQCDCWQSPTAGAEGSPSSWCGELFEGIAGSAAYVGARAFMCRRKDLPDGAYRGMHISLADGKVRIDIPLLADDPETLKKTPLYVQSIYCPKHRRVERELLYDQKPTTPIRWEACNK